MTTTATATQHIVNNDGSDGDDGEDGGNGGDTGDDGGGDDMSNPEQRRHIQLPGLCKSAFAAYFFQPQTKFSCRRNVFILRDV